MLIHLGFNNKSYESILLKLFNPFIFTRKIMFLLGFLSLLIMEQMNMIMLISCKVFIYQRMIVFIRMSSHIWCIIIFLLIQEVILFMGITIFYNRVILYCINNLWVF